MIIRTTRRRICYIPLENNRLYYSHSDEDEEEEDVSASRKMFVGHNIPSTHIGFRKFQLAALRPQADLKGSESCGTNHTVPIPVEDEPLESGKLRREEKPKVPLDR
jgi:hypothetical protein